ncbi:MAG: hypothetical protein MI673_05145 [Thiotrichales bacterium]|nr:hypothetical protein [Thiotrichales bacterium]
MKDDVKNGTIREIDGKFCVYFDGYWIRHYSTYGGRFADKKSMIDQMTRRVFHHVEVGINTPGCHLDKIRASYDAETCDYKKRVKAAMLAGALLNRGRDILTAIVNLESAGVTVGTDNPLFSECGKCLSEALELGKNIKLNDGGEGNTELWGEPFRVFTMPTEEFFKTRYIKLAQTMSEIDKVSHSMTAIIEQHEVFSELKPLLMDFVKFAKEACETLRSDPTMFEIWPAYVAARERFNEFELIIPENTDAKERRCIKDEMKLIKEGGERISRHANLRVPMPAGVHAYIEKCNEYLQSLA